jgi:hypothetical protein
VTSMAWAAGRGNMCASVRNPVVRMIANVTWTRGLATLEIMATTLIYMTSKCKTSSKVVETTIGSLTTPAGWMGLVKL